MFSFMSLALWCLQKSPKKKEVIKHQINKKKL